MIKLEAHQELAQDNYRYIPVNFNKIINSKKIITAMEVSGKANAGNLKKHKEWITITLLLD